MARIRYIKPGFFLNETLCVMPALTRLLFEGLWCWADREGRLEDRPMRLRAQILPFDQMDAEQAIGELTDGGFLVRYVVDGQRLLQIVNWPKHQRPHRNERPSVFPAPSEGKITILGTSKDGPRTVLRCPGELGNWGTGEKESTALSTGVDRREDKQPLLLTAPPTPKKADEDLDEVVTLWNIEADPLFGRVATLNDTRRQKIRKARKVLPDLAAWRRAIQRLNAWSHARGQNDIGWHASFDYLISNDKHGNLNVLTLAEGGKGGAPKRDVTRGHQSEGDWDSFEAEQRRKGAL